MKKDLIASVGQHSVWIGTLIIVSNLELPKLALNGSGYAFRGIRMAAKKCEKACFSGATKLTEYENRLFQKSEELSEKLESWRTAGEQAPEEDIIIQETEQPETV